MSASSRHRFRRDEAGVSEVIGYLFSFAMAVLILVTSLYAFSQINDAARVLSAQAELRDVTNRVSLAVQESMFVASKRNDSKEQADSSVLRYARTVTIPIQIQGWDYSVSLDRNFVNATSPTRALLVGVPTFNAAVSLPAPGNCTSAFIVCELEGSVDGNKGRIVISYLYNATPPVTNEIALG